MKALAVVDAEAAKAKTTKAFFMVDMVLAPRRKCVTPPRDNQISFGRATFLRSFLRWIWYKGSLTFVSPDLREESGISVFVERPDLPPSS
jgi:hypothetical protein